MRIIDWMLCKHKIPINAFLLYFRVSGIHPAADKRPLSASLVGRSSHVKLSVKSIARSILRCWILRQRNLSVISGPLNVRMQEKESRQIWSRVVRFSAMKPFAIRILNGRYEMFCVVWRSLSSRC